MKAGVWSSAACEWKEESRRKSVLTGEWGTPVDD